MKCSGGTFKIWEMIADSGKLLRHIGRGEVVVSLHIDVTEEDKVKWHGKE